MGRWGAGESCCKSFFSSYPWSLLCLMPNAQYPMPNAQYPMPNAQIIKRELLTGNRE